MKNVKKAFLGVTLGASLCAGLLVGATPVHADMLWFCTGTPPAVPAFVIQCPDPIFVDGVRYRNVGVWCNNRNPPLSVWYYVQA